MYHTTLTLAITYMLGRDWSNDRCKTVSEQVRQSLGTPRGSLETGGGSMRGPGHWQLPCPLGVQLDKTEARLPGDGAELQETPERKPPLPPGCSAGLSTGTSGGSRGVFPFCRDEG